MKRLNVVCLHLAEKYFNDVRYVWTRLARAFIRSLCLGHSDLLKQCDQCQGLACFFIGERRCLDPIMIVQSSIWTTSEVSTKTLVSRSGTRWPKQWTRFSRSLLLGSGCFVSDDRIHFSSRRLVHIKCRSWWVSRASLFRCDQQLRLTEVSKLGVSLSSIKSFFQCCKKWFTGNNILSSSFYRNAFWDCLFARKIEKRQASGSPGASWIFI